MGEVLNWNTEGTSKSKISQLESTFSVDQQVLWLQVSVKHLMSMTLLNPIQQLIEEFLAMKTVSNDSKNLP